jgi:hypothetical protein
VARGPIQGDSKKSALSCQNRPASFVVYIGEVAADCGRLSGEDANYAR